MKIAKPAFHQNSTTENIQELFDDTATSLETGTLGNLKISETPIQDPENKTVYIDEISALCEKVYDASQGATEYGRTLTPSKLLNYDIATALAPNIMIALHQHSESSENSNAIILEYGIATIISFARVYATSDQRYDVSSSDWDYILNNFHAHIAGILPEVTRDEVKGKFITLCKDVYQFNPVTGYFLQNTNGNPYAQLLESARSL